MVTDLSSPPLRICGGGCWLWTPGAGSHPSHGQRLTWGPTLKVGGSFITAGMAALTLLPLNHHLEK